MGRGPLSPAPPKVPAAAGSRDVGLFIANAGADPNGAHFLQRDIDTWINLVNRNVINVMRCCHYFGGIMRERRRGGILLVGSGAGYGGGSYMATYSASKAFELCFAESLWAELNAFSVDMLYLVLSVTNTPELQRLPKEKGTARHGITGKGGTNGSCQSRQGASLQLGTKIRPARRLASQPSQDYRFFQQKNGVW